MTEHELSGEQPYRLWKRRMFGFRLTKDTRTYTGVSACRQSTVGFSNMT